MSVCLSWQNKKKTQAHLCVDTNLHRTRKTNERGKKKGDRSYSTHQIIVKIKLFTFLWFWIIVQLRGSFILLFFYTLESQNLAKKKKLSVSLKKKEKMNGMKVLLPFIYLFFAFKIVTVLSFLSSSDYSFALTIELD